jgi:hypothetical protein
MAAMIGRSSNQTRNDWDFGSVNLEYRYQHISNANLAHRNLGVNAHGPMLAVSFFF